MFFCVVLACTYKKLYYTKSVLNVTIGTGRLHKKLKLTSFIKLVLEVPDLKKYFNCNIFVTGSICQCYTYVIE